jgi:N-acetylglucosamine kinase-like BadF-type ATPase
MRLVVRVADGRVAPTPLADAVMAHLEVSTPRAMLNRLQPANPTHLSRAAIARMAPLVLAAAQSGDETAREILERGAAELGEMVVAVSRQLNPADRSRQRVAAAGGLLENHPEYFGRVAAAVQKRLPGVVLARAQLPPVAGALLLALGIAGHPASPETVQHVSAAAAGSVA